MYFILYMTGSINMINYCTEIQLTYKPGKLGELAAALWTLMWVRKILVNFIILNDVMEMNPTIQSQTGRPHGKPGNHFG